MLHNEKVKEEEKDAYGVVKGRERMIYGRKLLRSNHSEKNLTRFETRSSSLPKNFTHFLHCDFMSRKSSESNESPSMFESFDGKLKITSFVKEIESNQNS